MRHNGEKLADIYLALKTDPDRGLTEEQAAEVQREKGLNVFAEGKKETVLHKVLHHLKDFTSVILMVAAAISFFLALQSGHGFADPIVILAIVIIDTILAVYQEMDAERSLEALKNMNAQMAVVIRGGRKRSLDAVMLVPGDILSLEAGDIIPADARIIESLNLKVDESILTGESVPVEKDINAEIPENAPLGDMLDMVFSGCMITFGRVKAVVVETGMGTEIGKIAGLLGNTKKVKTPLQKRMVKLGKTLSYIAMGSAAILFILQYLLYDVPVLEILMNAVALAVAAVPETLPVIITITLAFGVRVMARKKAIIRQIPAVETLGSATVICSDKTGTLTMNRMSIQRIWAAGHEPNSVENDFNHDEKRLVEMMGLASNAVIEHRDGEEKAIGDPTEIAIIRLLKEKHIEKESLDTIFPKVFEIPFDSERKLMTTVHEIDDLEDVESRRYISITKGAYDMIPVDAATVCFETAARVHDEFAENALRILAVAYKYYHDLPDRLDARELEGGLTFAGFVGMIDPPRPESAAAVATAREARIKTVMITGDHVVTASAIAREIGILKEADKAITGAELDMMPDAELVENVKRYSVYARVSPEDKIRIVQAWQAHGEVVAMTGDGVNDAPALKAADVGVSMGSGTDVSKNASDVILTDDNFATIVDAVEEGRRVYDNIRKAFFSLLSDNVAEIIVMLFAIIRGWGTPFVAIHLLYINVVADGVPDMFFCREMAEDNIMKRKPVDKNGSLFADGLGRYIGTMAVVLTVVTLVGFYIGTFVALPGSPGPSLETGRTMAFVINAWSSVINSFNIRSYKKSLFAIGIASNRSLFLGIMASIGLTAVVATVPVLAGVFYCVPLTANHWLIMIALSVAPLFVGEIRKLVRRNIVSVI